MATQTVSLYGGNLVAPAILNVLRLLWRAFNWPDCGGRIYLRHKHSTWQKQVITLSYGVPVRERYGSTLLPATREQHDQNCTQSH